MKEDGNAHYVILKRDSSTATWFTAAEKVYSNKYTVTGLLPGRKYFFRVIARNDIGDSDPLDSKDSWHINKDKGKTRSQYDQRVPQQGWASVSVAPSSVCNSEDGPCLPK